MKDRQLLRVVLFIVFLGFIGISIPYLIFPPLFLNPEYSFLPLEWGSAKRAILLGITLAAYPFGQFIGSPILGAMSDQHGRKPLLTGSLFFAALANLMSGIAIAQQNLWLLILSRFIAGLMEGNLAIARAMATEMKSLPKQETFGKINAASSTAYLLGPLLGGVLADQSVFPDLNAATPFYVITFLFVFLGIFTAKVLKQSNPNRTAEKGVFWQKVDILARVRVLFQNRGLRIFLLAYAIFCLGMDMFYEYSPAHLTLKWNLTPKSLIYYNGALCLGLTVGSGWLTPFISRRVESDLPLIYAIGVLPLFLMGVLLVNSSIWMMVLLGAIGLSIGVAATLITVRVSDAAPDSIQGEVMGVQQSLRVFGDGLICLLGGALLVLSAKLIILLAGLLLFVLFLYFVRRERALSYRAKTHG